MSRIALQIMAIEKTTRSKCSRAYGDLLYFCEVRWLSRGAMLSHVCGLQKEIATFCRQKNLSHADQLFDPRWLSRLALLTDLTICT